MTNEEIDLEIEKYMNSGQYKVVDLSIFEVLEHLTFEEGTLEQCKDTLEKYKEYVQKLMELSEEERTIFLQAIKSAEIVDNQKLEKENSFLIGLYMQTQKLNAIDYLLSVDSPLTKENVKISNQLILQGTSHEKYASGEYRQNNRKFVGKWNIDGSRDIKYFPLPYPEIDHAMEKLLAYYNQETVNEIDILLKPLIVHGLIAALQMFEDGNTRLGRVIQSIELWHLSNQFLETKLPQPALYMSRSYYPFREQYREKITNIVVENNQEGWNNWLHFNLNRIEDQIQFNEYNLEQYRTRLNYEHAKKR